MRDRVACVVGENLVDLFVYADGHVSASGGGGPFNVARTLARLGQSVLFFSGVSRDSFGTRLREDLLADGVRLAFDAPVELPSTLAIVDVSDQPRYDFHLQGTAAFALDTTQVLERFEEAVAELASLYVGTLALVVEPMATQVETMVQLVEDDTLVVLDPNCRPSAISERPAYLDRLNRLYRRCDVVKVSTEDLTYLSPNVDVNDAARALLAIGPSCVIVTDGSGPVRLFSQSGRSDIDVPSVDVVDTVGAGDALVGGFLAWWSGHGLSRSSIADVVLVEQALRWAVQIASLTCTRHGADPPRWHELATGPTSEGTSAR